MGLMIFRGVKIPFKFHPHDGRDLNYRRDCPWYFRGGWSTGRSFVIFLGITTILLFIITASLGLLIFKGRSIPFKVQPTMVSIGVIMVDNPW